MTESASDLSGIRAGDKVALLRGASYYIHTVAKVTSRFIDILVSYDSGPVVRERYLRTTGRRAGCTTWLGERIVPLTPEVEEQARRRERIRDLVPHYHVVETVARSLLDPRNPTTPEELQEVCEILRVAGEGLSRVRSAVIARRRESGTLYTDTARA